MVVQSPAFFASQIPPGNVAQLNTMDPGQVFTFKGNDFLSPNTVLRNIDTFSSGAKGGGDVFGKNPSSRDILSVTSNTAQSIFSGNFGVPANTQQQQINSTTVNPFTGVATTTLPNTTVFSTVTQTPSPALLSDLANFNPLIWFNPSASNVTLGIMDSANKIFGGNGLFPSSVSNSANLFPFIAPPQTPFSNFNIPITGNKVNTLSQAQLFPVTADTGSSFFNTTLTPFAVAPNTQTAQPLTTLVGLFGILISTMRQA